MELKPYFLLDWDPVIFNDGKIYVVGDGQEDGCLAAHGKRLSLMKLGNIGIYEKLCLERSKKDIEQFQKDFLEVTIKREVKESDAAKRALEENATLSFIVREVLPALTRANEEKEIKELLGVKADIQEKTPKAALSGAVADIDVRENNAVIERLIKKVEKEYEGLTQQIAQPDWNNLPKDTIEELLKAKYQNINYRPIKNKQTENQILDILQACTPKMILPADKHAEEADDSILGSLLHGPTAVFGGRIYDLTLFSGEQDNLSAYIGNQKFGFSRSKQQMPEIFQDYMRLLEKKFKIDALRNNGTQSAALAEAQKERQALREILQTNNYEKAGVGFLKKDNTYYVYVETPEQYALQSPHNGKYYLFKKARIAVQLFNEGRRIYAQNPLVMGKYPHPFTGVDANYGRICLGEYNYERTRNLPPLESVLTFLSDAKGVILQGYFDMSHHTPMANLDDYHFGDQVISEEYIQKNNIPVFNKNIVKIHKNQERRRWD